MLEFFPWPEGGEGIFTKKNSLKNKNFHLAVYLLYLSKYIISLSFKSLLLLNYLYGEFIIKQLVVTFLIIAFILLLICLIDFGLLMRIPIFLGFYSSYYSSEDFCILTLAWKINFLGFNECWLYTATVINF